MSNRIDVQITGLEHTQEIITQLQDALQNEIDDEVSVSAIQIRTKAIRNITRLKIVDQGLLKSSMVVTNSGRDYYVMNTAYYSPFVEFGTGARVNVPAEWTDYAAQFKNTSRGNFDDFVAALAEWARRKGISVDDGDYDNFAFWVALKILHNGLEARPFFYPAYDEVRTALIKRVKLIVNKALR